MIIHGIPIEKIKSLSDEQWQELDEALREEYKLILSYENMLPDDFVDKKNSFNCWESDFIAEFVFT